MPHQKTILITGCSSGIGQHCARQLHAAGEWRVFATTRRPQDAPLLQQAGIATLPLDLASPDSIHTAVSEILNQTDGTLDALFNNGAYGQPGAVEDLSRDMLREQFETNVFGTQELTNAVIPAMRRAGGGKIIQNSSVLGFVALRYRGAYNASKYALEGLSDTMRQELKNTGIHVVLIEPGPIASDFRKNATAKFNQHFPPAAIAASPHAAHYRTRLAQDADTTAPPFTLPPQAVHRALLRALRAKRPHPRYRVTVPTHLFWWAKRLLPTRLLDTLLARL